MFLDKMVVFCKENLCFSLKTSILLMKIEDFRAKNEGELETELLALKKEQLNLRFQRATGQIENTARVRSVRRDIARIKTVYKQRARQSS